MQLHLHMLEFTTVKNLVVGGAVERSTGGEPRLRGECQPGMVAKSDKPPILNG